MDDKNQQALALAFKKCRGKLLKIRELKITPDMKEKDIDKLIETLSTAKAADPEVTHTMAEIIARQRWYIEGLVKFSGLTDQQRLDSEYDDCFADTASEAEMLEALSKMAA